jgi:putative MATE family efflux protein
MKRRGIQQKLSIKQQFFKYVSQNIMGMVGVSCYILADTFFISKAAGANGITLLNLVLPIYGVIFAIGSMIGVGSAIRFNILRAQQEERAQWYFSNALFWILLISIPFVVAGICMPEKVIQMMGGDSAIMELGKNYTRIFLMFTPFFMANYVFTSYLRNDYAPTLAMCGTLAGNISNIILDYMFMFPMKMGLPGAAMATSLSPIISILVCSIHFLSKKNTVHFQWCLPSAKWLFEACQLGISAFVGELSGAVTTAVFNFLILGLVGNLGVAAYGIVANLALVAAAIFNGISQGMQPLASSFYGQRKNNEVRQILRLGIGTAVSFAILLIAAVWLFTDSFVAIFNSEQSVELAEYAHDALRFYILGYLFAGFNIVVTGFFGATDRPKAAFAASMLRGVAAIVVCAYVMSRFWGLNGVWFSFAVSEGLTAVVAMSLLLHKNKKEQFRFRMCRKIFK